MKEQLILKKLMNEDQILKLQQENLIIDQRLQTMETCEQLNAIQAERSILAQEIGALKKKFQAQQDPAMETLLNMLFQNKGWHIGGIMFGEKPQ